MIVLLRFISSDMDACCFHAVVVKDVALVDPVSELRDILHPEVHLFGWM